MVSNIEMRIKRLKLTHDCPSRMADKRLLVSICSPSFGSLSLF